MQTPTLLTHLTAAATLLCAVASAQKPAAQVVRGIDGDVVGTEESLVSSVGGATAPPLGSVTWIQPIGNRVYQVGIGSTGTGWKERAVVGVPDIVSGPLPILVLFHGYGEDPEVTTTVTDYLEKARQRGWLVVAPLGAHKYNFGIDYAQRNTEAALALLARYFPIDLDRAYGIGFSMGAGWMASFASRHTGENHLRFAALVNHTGTPSVANVHANAVSTSLLESKLMFGGPPLLKAFRYSTASAMDLLSVSNQVDASTDLVRNINHVPIRTFTCVADPLLILVNQCERLDAHRDQLGAGSDYTAGSSAVSGLGHHWNTLAEDPILDWLATRRLTFPTGQQLVPVLADRNERFHHFGITQRVSGEFTPFKWAALPAMNRAYILKAENLEQVSFQPSVLGLDPHHPAGLEVLFEELNGLTTEVVLEDVDAPSNVLLNGQSTTAWSYDASKRLLTLTHVPGGMSISTWTVLP